MISSLLHLVGLGPRVYYTLTNFMGGGQRPPCPPPSMRQCCLLSCNNYYFLENCTREQFRYNVQMVYGLAGAVDKCVLLAQWITWLTRDCCNPKVSSSIPAGGKDFP